MSWEVEREQVRKLWSLGYTRAAISRETGITPERVSELSAEMNLTYKLPENTAKRAAERRKKAADKRAELAEEILDDAVKLRSQMWTPTVIGSFGGRENIYNETTIPEPTHSDKLKIAQTTDTLLRAHERLMKQDEHSSQQPLNLIRGIARQLGLEPNE